MTPRHLSKVAQAGKILNFPLENRNSLGYSLTVNKTELKQFTSWLGKRSYKVRLERMGLERIQEIARENGKKGGRPPKKGKRDAN